jgi:hypothetical protein
MTSARTSAALHADRVSDRNRGTLPSKLLCDAGRRLCSGRPGHEPGLSRSRTTPMVAPGRRARTRGRPRLRTIWIEAPDGAPPRAVGAQHRQRHRGDRRRRAPHGPRAVSRDRLLNRLAATATGDHDAAVRKRLVCRSFRSWRARDLNPFQPCARPPKPAMADLAPRLDRGPSSARGSRATSVQNEPHPIHARHHAGVGRMLVLPEFVVLADRPQSRTNRIAVSRHDAATESQLPGERFPQPADREGPMRAPLSGLATSRLRGGFRIWSVTGSWLV